MFSARARLWAKTHPRTARALVYAWSIYWNIVHWGTFRSTRKLNVHASRLCMKAYRRWIQTAKPEYFLETVRHFIEGVDSDEANPHEALVVIGWGDKGYVENLKSLVLRTMGKSEQLSLRTRIFRPDTLLMTQKSETLFCGFKLVVRLESAVANELLASFRSSGSDEGLVSSGYIDYVSFNYEEGSKSFLNEMSSKNLSALAEIVDWSGNVTAAQSLLQNLPVDSLRGMTFEAVKPWLKILLVAENLPTRKSQGANQPNYNLKTLRRLEVSQPTWNYTDTNNATWPAGQVSIHHLVRPKYVLLKQVSVFSGGTVFDKNRLWDIDSASHPALDFVAGRWHHVVGANSNMRAAFLKLPARKGPSHQRGILLSSRADQNWFHWLVETLPKLFLVDEEVDDSWPIIVSDHIPKTARESLEFLTGRVVIELETSWPSEFEELCVPGPVIFHPDSVMFWNSPQMEIMNPAPLRLLRERVLEKSGLGPQTGNLKIFVTRQTGVRNLENRAQVRRMLLRRGFVEVNASQLTFRQQVALFSSAAEIVFEGGAVMSNLIFCTPGSRAVVLVGPEVASYEMPRLLGDVSEVKVQVVPGRSTSVNKSDTYLEKIHAPYKVRVRDVKAALISINN